MPVRAPGSRLEHGFEIVPMGVLEVLMADEAELIVRGAPVYTARPSSPNAYGAGRYRSVSPQFAQIPEPSSGNTNWSRW
jgi:hypothetical protein